VRCDAGRYGTVNALIGSEAVMNAVIIIIVCCVAVATCKLLPSAEIKKEKKRGLGHGGTAR
jgi:hypothetical protein